MTAPAIKAIETRYRGYRFRSRTEARWAVFFDAIGIEWQYEPEGYQLSDGRRYLPDFYLPSLALWWECKPGKPKSQGWIGPRSLDAGEDMAALMAVDLECNIAVCAGPPGIPGADENGLLTRNSYEVTAFCGNYDPKTCVARSWFRDDSSMRSLAKHLRREWMAGNVSELVPRYDGSVGLIRRMISLDREYFLAKYGKEHHAWPHGAVMMDGMQWQRSAGKLALGYEPNGWMHDEEIAGALGRASSARFEHGESG